MKAPKRLHEVRRPRPRAGHRAHRPDRAVEGGARASAQLRLAARGAVEAGAQQRGLGVEQLGRRDHARPVAVARPRARFSRAASRLRSATSSARAARVAQLEQRARDLQADAALEVLELLRAAPRPARAACAPRRRRAGRRRRRSSDTLTPTLQVSFHRRVSGQDAPVRVRVVEPAARLRLRAARGRARLRSRASAAATRARRRRALRPRPASAAATSGSTARRRRRRRAASGSVGSTRVPGAQAEQAHAGSLRHLGGVRAPRAAPARRGRARPGRPAPRCARPCPTSAVLRVLEVRLVGGERLARARARSRAPSTSDQ